MKARRILHSSVNVAGELDRTRAFYEGLLGLEPAPRPEMPGVGGAWYSIDDAQIHLVDAPRAGRGIDPTGPHLCVAVDDIEAAVAELEVAGIEYLRAAQGEIVQVWVVDPAGNTVEIQQERRL